MASPVPEATRLCLRQLSRATRQTRSFSSSASRRKNGALSVFPPTSSPELDALLASLRTTVFMPAHLKEQQRHLVYRKYWQRFLTGEEPVQIEVPVTYGGNSQVEIAQQQKEQQPDKSDNRPTESFVLRPLDARQEHPKHAATLNKIFDLLRTAPDAWQLTLPQLLRELHVSGRALRPQDTEKLVRLASAAGKLGLVLECLRRVERLGLKVSTTGIARQLVAGAHQRAAAAGFGLGEGEEAEGRAGGIDAATDIESRRLSEKELDRAVKNVDMIMLLIEDGRHAPLGQPDDPKECPELYGGAMALAAVRRLLYVTENTPEKVAARLEVVKTSAAMPQVELPEGAEEALETASGETPAQEAAEAAENDEVAAAVAETEGSSSTPDSDAATGPLFTLGEGDLARVEKYGMKMLDLSEKASLDCDLALRRDVNSMLDRWLPTWFGIQLATKVLPADSSLRSRLQKAFEAEIDPQVRRAVDALQGFEARGTLPRSQLLYDAYTRFLGRTGL